MIHLEQVRVCYGNEVALSGLTVSLRDKRIYGVVGSDGAGKTTLLKLLAGLLKPADGIVRRDPAVTIGLVSEHFGLYEEMSIEENLLFYGSLYGLSADETRKRSKNWLEWTGLAPFRARRAGLLSGGMKRKLATVAAMLHQPKILILDEPTGGVDPVSRRDIWRLIQAFKQSGATVVVATQYLDEIPYCDEVLFLYRGKMLRQGEPKELIKQFPYQVYRVREMRGKPLSVLKEWERVPGVRAAFLRGVDWIFLCETDDPAKRVNEWLKQKGWALEMEKVSPTFEEMFIDWIKKEGEM